MVNLDARLAELREQTARARQLTAMMEKLRSQRQVIFQKVLEQEKVASKEQIDVNRLEGGSLTAFCYNVIGKRDEKLDRERREAYAARVKYEAAARELEDVVQDLKQCESELASLGGCEDRYRQAMEEKTVAIQAEGGAGAKEIFRLEERHAVLEGRKKELREAVWAGESALRTAKMVLSSLDSAEGWGTWDLVGGGFVSDLAKHSNLDEAQSGVEQLQSQLRRFQTELADVTIPADLQVSVDGFLEFADYFFDGIFADWAVLDRIHQSQEQVRNVIYRIRDALSRLNSMAEEAEQEQTRIREQLDQLVLQTRLSQKSF